MQRDGAEREAGGFSAGEAGGQDLLHELFVAGKLLDRLVELNVGGAVAGDAAGDHG